MSVTADTTLIAQALATARACARQAAASRTREAKDFVMQTMEQELATFESALEALRRIEAEDNG